MKKIIILLFFAQSILGQEVNTIYYGDNYNITSKDSAVYLRNYIYDSISKKYKFEEFLFFKAPFDFIKSGELTSINPEIKDGKFEWKNSLGDKVVCIYKKNMFFDIVEYKDENDSLLEPVYEYWMIDSINECDRKLKLFSEKFSNDLLNSGEIDMKFINSKTYVLFVVDKDGAISDAKILRGVEDKFNKSIIDKLVKYKFPPMTFKGKRVKVLFAMPVIINK
ncbi:MAG: hypothetical protein WCK02_08265 [Bacteroidota bacterium]